jgi:3-dehydroquinate synthase
VPFAYPVIFTRGVFDPGNTVLRDEVARPEPARRHRMAVFVDSGVAEAWPGLGARIEAYVAAHPGTLALVHPPRVVPGGETIKTDLGGIRNVMHEISRWGLCRHSYVVAVGGGAVLDAVGFCASLVHRGLRMVRIPTTVLAQNDAGIGVKTGIDTDGGKNTAGTFAPPFAVLNDLDFLATLSDPDWIGGTAEAFKVAILKDREFFAFLRAKAPAIPARDPAVMERLVVECARLHLDHIRTGGDPFESGAARPLDFGHWAAHQLESMSGYRIRHGQAVAAGIALDSCYARAMGWLDGGELGSILDALEGAGFALWYPEFDRRGADGSREILDGLRTFREHLGGELCVTFPDGIGSRREVGAIDTALVETCLARLRERHTARAPRS